MPETNELIDYIRQAAIKRGINPDVALRVAQHEGGLRNPFRKGEGPAPKSQSREFGRTENSYGPFQLYISGTGAGLGDRALRAGIDPRKNWRGGIDFALDEVTRKGWGQWYGAKAAGINGFDGVGKGAKATGEYGTAQEGDTQYTASAIPKGNVSADDDGSTWDDTDPETGKKKSRWATLGENLGGLGDNMMSEDQTVAPTPNMEAPDTSYAQAAIPTDYWQQYMQTAAQGGTIQHLDEGGTVEDPDEDDGTRFNQVLKMMGLMA